MDDPRQPDLLCGDSLTKALGAHPEDGGSAPPPRSNVPRGPAEPDPDDIIPLDQSGEEAGEPAGGDAVNDAAGPSSPGDGIDIDMLIALGARLTAGEAPKRFLDRRLQLELKHGANAITDLSRPAHAIARDLRERAAAVHDGLPARAGPPPRAAILAAMARLETLGALAFALHDRLAADLAGSRAPDPEHGRGAISSAEDELA